MPSTVHNSEILYFCDGFLSLQLGKIQLKVRASFQEDGPYGGTFTGTVDDGPVRLLSKTVTVTSPDLIRAHAHFKLTPRPGARPYY